MKAELLKLLYSTVLSFAFLFVPQDRVSLYNNTGCPGTHFDTTLVSNWWRSVCHWLVSAGIKGTHHPT